MTGSNPAITRESNGVVEPMIAHTTQVNVHRQLAYLQRVVVTDNGDPADPWTGMAGTVQRASQWRSGMVYEVWLDTLVRGRHITSFRADELEQIDER